MSRLGKPAALFLDDFQAIRNSTFIAFFRDLFDGLPENVRIFVGSRALPQVGLAKLLVGNIALVLRAGDLRFSPSEVDRFFAASRDLKVSSQEIGAIYRRTEGWPAALQLYRLTLSSPEVRSSLTDLNTDSPRELAEYLADNVLALQSRQTQDFLLKTSLLTRLSADLCDSITGRSDSQGMLQALERSGLFIRSLDADSRWFKYHGLFSTIMAENLRKLSAPTVLDVHARAAQWHLSQSLYEEVVYHALACGDHTLAADTLNVWASRLVASGQLMTVERWFERLPLERVLERPDLVVKVAHALIFLRREHRLRPLLDFLKTQTDVGDLGRTTSPRVALSMAAVLEDDFPTAVRLADSLQRQYQRTDGFAAFERGAANNVLAYRDLAEGNFEAARKRLAAARMVNERGGATFSGGYTVAMSGACLMFQGKLREALAKLRKQKSEESAHMDGSFASAALASCHIWACYEANELDAVESLYARYHDNIADSVIPDFIAIAHVAMARACDARGRPDKALEVLDDLEKIAYDSGWARLIGMADWERVRRALVSGDVERACQIAAHAAANVHPFPETWISMSDDLEGESLGRVRLAVHGLDAAVAASRISRELQRHPQRTYRRIKLYLMDALLRAQEGMHSAAHRSLRKALHLAKPDRYIRCFLDEGEGVVQLLRETYRKIFVSGPGDNTGPDSDQAFLEELLSASGLDLTRDRGKSAKTAIQPLSDREKEMLLYLADGLSNKDMAQRLFVSENTVKFHLKNIYSKLGVANRLQAINVSREGGLVP